MDTSVEVVVSVQGLCHDYEHLRAVDRISFDIKKGQIFSFLGPNGAGKTTTINLLITLLPIQQGKVTIAGFDVAREKGEVRKSIGVVFQDQRLDRDLKVWEILDFHGKLYSIPKEVRKARIDELLKLVELEEKRNELTKNLSGGLKRRLEIARGLLVRPKVLFLDEPTIGLDTQSRKRIWSYIRKVNREEGVTVLLTTHYMDEADQNSDVICIIDKGKIIANGTPENLKKSLNQDHIQLKTSDDEKTFGLIKNLAFINEVQILPEGLEVSFEEDSASITKLIDVLRKDDLEIINIVSVKPTLDDVFIHYTGRGINELNQENSSPET